MPLQSRCMPGGSLDGSLDHLDTIFARISIPTEARGPRGSSNMTPHISMYAAQLHTRRASFLSRLHVMYSMQACMEHFIFSLAKFEYSSVLFWGAYKF
jgi:hypothetical protein